MLHSGHGQEAISTCKPHVLWVAGSSLIKQWYLKAVFCYGFFQLQNPMVKLFCMYIYNIPFHFSQYLSQNRVRRSNLHTMLRRMGRGQVKNYSRNRPLPEHMEFPHSLMLQSQNMCGACLLHTPRNLLIWGVNHGGKQGKKNLLKRPAVLFNTLCWRKRWYTLSLSRKCCSNDLALTELLQLTQQSFA